MGTYVYGKSWYEFSQEQRFIAMVDDDLDEPLGDLAALAYIARYVSLLEEDLRLVQEIQGLWVMRLLEEKRYLAATIARALDTPSGQVAVTRIKRKYGETYRNIRHGEYPPSKDVIDGTIQLGENLAADPEMPTWVHEAYERKLVLLYHLRSALYGLP